MTEVAIFNSDGRVVVIARVLRAPQSGSPPNGDFAFEALEEDVVALEGLRLQQQVFYIDKVAFLGELTQLEPAISTAPALAPLRNIPSVRGVIRYVGPATNARPGARCG